jgi:hypothetical protein
MNRVEKAFAGAARETGQPAIRALIKRKKALLSDFF